MKCDRCKKDMSFWELIPLSFKDIKPEFKYMRLLGGGKHLFCEDCMPIVAINKVEEES